jgi:hypothetical protein
MADNHTAALIKDALRVRRIDVDKTRFSASDGLVCLSLPGDDGYDIFYGETTQELLDQVIQRCDRYLAVGR